MKEKTCRSVSDHNINPSFERAHTLTAIRQQERTGGCATTPSKRLSYRRNARMVLRGESGVKILEKPIFPRHRQCFISFHLLERRKRVRTEVRCLSITFFCFSVSRAAMEMVYLWLLMSVSSLLSHLLSNGPRFSFFSRPRGWKIYYSDFFASFRCLWFHKGRPPFAPNVAVHGKHFSLLFAPEQTWREINPSLFLSVCLHLTNHGFKCEFRNFFLRSACFGFSGICFPAAEAKAPRTFVSGVRRWLSNDSLPWNSSFRCGKVCACLQIVLGCF